MLEIEKIQQLIEMMVTNDLVEISLRDGETEVNLRRPDPHANNGATIVTGHPGVPMLSAPLETSGMVPAPVEGTPASAEEHDDDLTEITSMMVGTFYAASDPESPPFVQVGSHIQIGTTICILEAMKVFNEIKSEVSGIVERILVNNGDSVEYGQPLFAIRTT